jgi:hypothetical protein
MRLVMERRPAFSQKIYVKVLFIVPKTMVWKLFYVHRNSVSKKAAKNREKIYTRTMIISRFRTKEDHGPDKSGFFPMQ